MAIAIEVTLILLIVGLSIGILRDSAERTRGIGADVMVSPPGVFVSNGDYRRSGFYQGG